MATEIEDYIQNLFADRIGGAQYGKGNAVYKFGKIKKAKQEALKKYPDKLLLDFGIGENDDMASPVVRETLKFEVDQDRNKGYTDNGIDEYKEAAARWMQRNFNVKLDSASEINHCIGSKAALAMIPYAFINPGDYTLMTVPGYPVIGTHTEYCGGNVYKLPLIEDNEFLPDLENIPADILKKAKILYINYPNSPSGTTAPDDFFKNVILFAKEHNLVVVHDAAHIMLTFDGKPKSFLEFDGAKEVGIEIHSMSKGFNMIGWRLGFVCGNPKIVKAFSDIKDNSDSGQFGAIQRAAIKALDDDSIHEQTREKYKRRLEKLVKALNEINIKAKMPGGTYFLYIKTPDKIDGHSFSNAEDAAQYLIKEKSIVVVPWDDAGSYLRFSVTYDAKDEQEEDTLMEELKKRLL